MPSVKWRKSPHYWLPHGRPTTPAILTDHHCLTYGFQLGTARALWPSHNDESRSTNAQVAGNVQTNNGEAWQP
jgi:hypothetical protein